MPTPSQENMPKSHPFDAIPGALAGDHWIESLRDGTRVLIRPLHQDDREREIAFVSGLSHRAKRFRFLGDFKQLTLSQVQQLMDVDYDHRMAFIALVHDSGQLIEIGISRYSATADERRCECAVTVADDWQGRGLGVLLMRHLIAYARRKGFKRMVSFDAMDNEGMRDLASYLGFRRELDPLDSSQAIHAIDL